MIKIIPPEQFIITAWKNGKGETVQLAISAGGTLEVFDWRLSIASVVEDGVFSDFSGYERNLILLQGNGIKLTHNDTKVDVLKKPLSVSNFSGSDRTVVRLLNGKIKDFNVITKAGKYKVCLQTYVEKQLLKVIPSALCFIYSKSDTSIIKTATKEILLAANHLLQLTDCKDEINIKGCQMIVVVLTHSEFR